MLLVSTLVNFQSGRKKLTFTFCEGRCLSYQMSSLKSLPDGEKIINISGGEPNATTVSFDPESGHWSISRKNPQEVTIGGTLIEDFNGSDVDLVLVGGNGTIVQVYDKGLLDVLNATRIDGRGGWTKVEDQKTKQGHIWGSAFPVPLTALGPEICTF